MLLVASDSAEEFSRVASLIEHNSEHISFALEIKEILDANDRSRLVLASNQTPEPQRIWGMYTKILLQKQSKP